MNASAAHEVAMNAQRSGKKFDVAELSLTYKVEQSGAWSRKRGFGCAGNVETMLVLTVGYGLWQMQNKCHTVGESTWCSNALVGVQRRHPSHAP